MSTVPPLARTFEALRPAVLLRVMERRPALDPVLGRLDEATARAQVDAVLEHLGGFLATGDLRLHRAFLQTFLAMRAAEAQSPASVLGTLVAIGDTAAQVAQDEGPGAPGGIAAELALRLVHVTGSMARALNDLVAEQLDTRRQSWRDLSSHQRAARR